MTEITTRLPGIRPRLDPMTDRRPPHIVEDLGNLEVPPRRNTLEPWVEVRDRGVAVEEEVGGGHAAGSTVGGGVW